MLSILRTVRPLAVAVAVSVSLAACGDDDPSGPVFSAETAGEVASVAENVIAPLETTSDLQLNLGNVMLSLSGLGGGSLSALQPFELLEAAREPLDAHVAPSVVAAPGAVLIPAEIEGTTFVWSADENAYVPSGQSGAPANGVRFIYYAVEPFTGYPVEPLNALGYIDLADASTDDEARLEILAVRDQGNVTLADYFVEGALSGNLSTTTVTIDSRGYFSDGSQRLDFDMGLEVSRTGDVLTEAASVALDADAGSIDFTSIETMEGEGDDAGIDGVTTFRVSGGGNVALFEATTSGTVSVGIIDGVLSFNGDDVVIVTGDADDPEFTQPDGGALTVDELQALGRMWVAAGLTSLFVFQTLMPFLVLLAFAGA